ncbi:DUF4834 family protein [Aquimarina sp. ERC-38]|uniref:DUF4834 family protein n=1 Tax=Aquimarina sp. ERC-38 TaxID=2949996 RepID=UPI002245FEA5|nr:DUF4834 family protein [Aquimarina sp. ERC-38]UZO82685.1 DUF4834 family protein [Aquimarina sp. ERC-38]
MTGVLKFILILLLIYYGLKVLTRLLGPLLLRYMTKKAGQKFEKFFQQQSTTQPSPEGEITIQKKSRRKTSRNSGGDYVDFEEID